MNTPYYVAPGPAYPTFVRPRSPRVIAGVASGLALQVRVDVTYVRIALVLASGLFGFGVMAYLSLWAFSANGPSEPDAREALRARVPNHLDLRWEWVVNAALVLAVAVLIGTMGATNGLTLAPRVLIVPVLVVGLGTALAWFAYDRGGRSRWAIASWVAGVGLVIAGVTVAVVRWHVGGMLGALMAVLFTATGVGVLAGPAIMRLWESQAQSRADAAAAEQRAAIAARLHDSVLQTLALIQKRADDPSQVIRLARAQERELRGWLFDPAEHPGARTVFAALAEAAGEVEDLLGVRIAPVTVGEDRQLDEPAEAIVRAAREAMLNAAKHAQVDSVDVYAEHVGGVLSVFVRDRGVGFDLAAMEPDRHGVRESIIARVERVGGQARVFSTPGEGTEVELTLS
ncbi:ATP-binding protein [Corynebacterium uterequi]|nr:ATP-binding protein [Corynebacterium uterequi]